MNCQEAQDWLLRADDPQADLQGAGEVAGHVRRCAECSDFASCCAALEETWRSLPLPPGAERSKAAFLSRFDKSIPAPAPRTKMISRRRLLQWCSASAAGLLVAGTGGWLLFSPRQVQADDELLDRLVDWNLQLAQSKTEAERSRLYEKQAQTLGSLIGSKRLPADEAALAGELLEIGAWQVSDQNPVDVAARFAGLADRLLQLAEKAKRRGNNQRMHRMLRQYNRLLSAVESSVGRAEDRGPLDVKHQKTLEHLVRGDSNRVKQLASLLEDAPDAARKEIEHALVFYQKKGKKARSKKSSGHKK
jgi:hypothetical protein